MPLEPFPIAFAPLIAFNAFRRPWLDCMAFWHQAVPLTWCIPFIDVLAFLALGVF